MKDLLTVNDVQKIRIDRARVNHETYKQLYKTVHERIRRRASVNSTHLTYAVPPFVPGRPVYTPGHAARYITDKLRRGGFGVMAVQDGGTTLFIDWTPRPRAPSKPVPPANKQHKHTSSSGTSSGTSSSGAPSSVTVSRQAIASRLEALKKLI